MLSGPRLIPRHKGAALLLAFALALPAWSAERIDGAAEPAEALQTGQSHSNATRQSLPETLEQKAAKLMKQDAEIEKLRREYDRRPRKTFVGLRVQDHRFARYVEDWAHRIERHGTLNFPSDEQGRLHGNLMMLVEIRGDGSLENAEITRSSRKAALDEAALRIVREAAPFAPFPPEISRDTDILVILRAWTFQGPSDNARSSAPRTP